MSDNEEEELDEIEEEEVVDEEIEKIDETIERIYIIPDNERKSSEMMTLFEVTEAIGIRISQIEQGSPIFIDYTGLTNARNIAEKEFYERQNPLIIRRIIKQVGKDIYIEQWRVREMVYPPINEDMPITTPQFNKAVR
jgi:hypothetical protein